MVDPRDLTAFGNAVAMLVIDRALADGLGGAARRLVRERSLPSAYLAAYLELFWSLLCAIRDVATSS